MDKFKESLGKAWGTVKTKWTEIGKKGHIIFFAVLGVVVASAVVAIVLASQTEYAVLYTGASAEERSEVLSIVNGLGATEVTVDENGDIIVPKDEVEQLRVQLSMQGYPKNAFNYDIWDNGVDMFSTESDKRIKEIQQLFHFFIFIPQLHFVSYVIVKQPVDKPLSSESVVVLTDLMNGC